MKYQYSLIIRLLFALTPISLFYFVFTPLTIYAIYLIFISYSPVVVGIQMFIGNEIFEFVEACIAGSAYYLLLILNILTKDIKFKTRVKPEKLKDYEVDFFVTQIGNAKKYMSAPIDVKITNIGLNVNSRNDDYSPILSPDGKMLYFTSRRPQSTGGHQADDHSFYEDIFFCKLNDDGTWSEADLLDGKINTDEFDNCSHLSADGTSMYITQNIEGATKSSDIAVSKLGKGGKWGMAKLIKPLNTSYFDACPTLTPDEKTIYFTLTKEFQT